jgi:uncharacterized protein (TIGR03083 family)
VNTEAAGHDEAPSPGHDREWFVEHLLADTNRFAEALRVGDLETPVAACPGWDLRRLTVHQGVIHRWARHCAANAAPPESRDGYQPSPDLDREALADWLTDGAYELVAVLSTIDPDGPTWHPFPGPKLGRVWPRRQAHETSVHRWDAEHCIGATTPIDPELASDGVDEYFDLMLRHHATRDSVTLPTGSLHLHCTDTHGEWFVSIDDGGYHLERAHMKGDAALRGPAEALLLRLWNRDTDRAGELSPVGDGDVLDDWLTLSTR